MIAFKLQQAPQQNIPDNISTVYATGCTQAFGVLCYFVRSNSGNKYQNNPFVSAETVRHSSKYIIPYIKYEPCMIHAMYCNLISCLLMVC